MEDIYIAAASELIDDLLAYTNRIQEESTPLAYENNDIPSDKAIGSIRETIDKNNLLLKELKDYDIKKHKSYVREDIMGVCMLWMVTLIATLENYIKQDELNIKQLQNPDKDFSEECEYSIAEMRYYENYLRRIIGMMQEIINKN